MNSEVFVKNWKALIDLGMGKIYGLYEDDVFVGGLGMLITHDINDGDLVATEAFWFVDPEKRGGGVKLLFFGLRKVKEIGCVRVIMMHLLKSNSEQISQLYESLGFSAIEKHYVKNL